MGEEYNRSDVPLRTEFRDGDGKIIAVMTCDNSDFLVDVESRMLGTRASAGESADAWVASATVTEGGTEVMEYEPRPEPANGGLVPPAPARLNGERERAVELLERWEKAIDPDDGSNDAEHEIGVEMAELIRRVLDLPMPGL